MKYSIFLLILSLTISCNKQKSPSFTVNGSIKGLDSYKDFYLENSVTDFIARAYSIDRAVISGSKTVEKRISYNILLSKFEKRFLGVTLRPLL